MEIRKIACSTVPSEWLLPELPVRFPELYLDVQEPVSSSESARAVERGIGVAFLSARPFAIEVDGVGAVRELYLTADPPRLPRRAMRAFRGFLDPRPGTAAPPTNG